MNPQCRVRPQRGAISWRRRRAGPLQPIARCAINQRLLRGLTNLRAEVRDELVCAVLFVTGGLALLAVLWSSLYPDGISYLRIAEHLLAGRLDEAVNGYWGPLYSWLLVPLLGLGVDGAAAMRLVNLAAGAGALAGFRRLSFQFGVNKRLVDLGSFGVGPYLWAQALNSEEGLTPDLLTAALVSWYLVFIGRRPRTALNAGIAGLFAGAAYLSKSYALPFFAAHICAVCAWELWIVRGRRAWRTPLRRFAAAGVYFGLLAAPWTAILSSHYGRPTFSTSGSYNLSLMHPEAQHPMYTAGLIPPPAPHGVSAWDDPTLLPMPEWRWWHSIGDLKIGLQAMVLNVRKAALDFAQRLGVSFGLALALGASLPLGAWDRRRRRQLAALLLTAALYGGGYVLTAKFLSHRYLLAVGLLLTAAALFFAEQVRRRSSRRAPLGALLAGAVAASMAVSAGSLLLDEYWGGRPASLRLRAIAASLEDRVPAGSRMASDDDWHGSLSLSYWLDGRYYGLPLPEDRKSQLQCENIDFLIVWKPQGWPDPPGRRLESDWEGPPFIYDQR